MCSERDIVGVMCLAGWLGVCVWISIGINISIIINENVTTTDVSLTIQTKDFFSYKQLCFDRFEIEGARERERGKSK